MILLLPELSSRRLEPAPGRGQRADVWGTRATVLRGSCSRQAAGQCPSPLGSLSLKTPHPGREPEGERPVFLSHLCLPPRINCCRGWPLGRAPSDFMGQEGGQLDLAVHGGSEAGAAVHSCAPVHGDHRGAVATQAQTALQNLLLPAQLQGDRRDEVASSGTAHKHIHFIHFRWPSCLEPGGCHPKLRTCPGTQVPPSRKSQVRCLDQEISSLSRLQLLLQLK